MRNLFVVMLAGLILAVPPAFAQDKKIIDISNPEKTKITVAVPPFLIGPGVDPKIAETAAELLSWDLNFSGVFQTVDKKAWLAKPQNDTLDEPQYDAWKASGAVALARGKIEKQGDKYRVEMRFYDTIQGKPFNLPGGGIGKVYTTSSDVRTAVHTFANALLELITQKSGPFLSRVVYEYREPKSSRKDLWVMNLDGTGRQALTQNKLLNLMPSFSTDGKQIVYTSYKRRNPDLYIMNLTDGSDRPLSERMGVNAGGVFSPDGQTIAAAMSFDGDSDIYLMDLTGKIIKKLTTSGAIDVQPAFSPDGKKIAFMSDRIGNPNIFIMNVDGTNTTRLTLNGKYNSSPAWSPTGEWIAYYSRDDGNIWLIRPDGSETKRLTNGEGNNEDPFWSPDGRYVLFSSNRAGTYDIWAADSISGTVTQITNLPGDERNPTWGPTFQ